MSRKPNLHLYRRTLTKLNSGRCRKDKAGQGILCDDSRTRGSGGHCNKRKKQFGKESRQST